MSSTVGNNEHLIMRNGISYSEWYNGENAIIATAI
jgi:hypothetical protein